MRSEGRLIRWNDERGFGFIAPTAGGSEVFVHVSAFPNDGRRPATGERVIFEVESGADGKQRAVNVLCPDRPRVMTSTRRPAAHPPDRRRRGRGVPIALALATGLAIYGHDVYTRHAAVDAPIAQPALPAPAIHNFKCDGRTRCAQMTSCEEATYFLRHCPGTEMDGDGDGVPCESQWCGR